MSKIILSLVFLTLSASLLAQPPKTVVKPANPFKTSADSVSYILGEIAAFGLVNQGLGNAKINYTIFNKAMADILGKKKPLISDSAANLCLNTYINKNQSDKNKPTIEEGKNFLAKNKIRAGVKTTASGLQYEVIKMGTGVKPTVVDTFVVHYVGTLLNGTEFDGSIKRGQPLIMPVSKVIPGWIEGLQLMPVGSKFKFWIPYNLGYGNMGQGAIPGGAMLIFEIELLDVKKKE